MEFFTDTSFTGWKLGSIHIGAGDDPKSPWPTIAPPNTIRRGVYDEYILGDSLLFEKQNQTVEYDREGATANSNRFSTLSEKDSVSPLVLYFFSQCRTKSRDIMDNIFPPRKL